MAAQVEGDFDGGVARHEEAFERNPNSVWICGCNGFGHALCRNSQRTLEMLERARRLSPGDPTMFLWLPGGAIVHFLAGRTEQAIQWTEDALRLNPRHVCARQRKWLPAKPTLAAAPWNGCAP